MDKYHMEDLPTYTDATAPTHTHRPSWIARRRKHRALRLIATACLAYLAYSAYRIVANTTKPSPTLSIERLQEDYVACASLRQKPADPSTARDYNKRWVNSTKPLLIRNATVWIGEPAAGTSEDDSRAGKGWSWITSDVFVDRGLIVKVATEIPVRTVPRDTEIFEAEGRPLTAGIVDMHSHAGLSSVGGIQDDTNELSSDITPYVRSIDGLDPLQPEMEYIKSGGVTTSLFLPGSGNNMGGEAFVLKFAVGEKNGRNEISQQDLFADPDGNWRYMKMACGENPKRIYGVPGKHGPYSRLGEGWEFRHALEQAQMYVREQDDWCASADRIGAENMNTYLRQELEWESLGAVLRGQVRVNTHCYTIPDLEAFVRLTNEFKFRIYAFHHAHQTFLIPEVLKRAWGGTPAAALFADNMYYKVEAYTASERAGAILYAHNITPTYVSDNPVLNSQHVVFEAAKAYGYGLPYHAALSGVTSAPAELLGLGDRIGKIKASFDADIVVWDSDPLSVGATPVQVWIDGAKQFPDPVVLKKPAPAPITPDPKLARELTMQEVEGDVIFKGVSHVHIKHAPDILGNSKDAVAVVRNGKLVCLGVCISHLETTNTPIITLQHGYITPPYTSFAASIGLQEIDAEDDTQDGHPPPEGIARAVDGLLFGGKQLSHAFAHGVTRAISAPGSAWSIDSRGVSAGFRTGAAHPLAKGAVWKDEVALHYPLTLHAKTEKIPSISSAIAELRSKLLTAVAHNAASSPEPQPGVPTKEQFEEAAFLRRVVAGTLPLVLTAHSADTLAHIITLKSTVEAAANASLRVVIVGAAEAHLVAAPLAAAHIPVVLAPLLPHAQSWDQRRGLTGAPLTNGTAINALLDAGVLVALSVEEMWETRDLGLLAGIAFANSEGRLEFREALDLVGKNVYRMLGLEREEGESGGEEWVVWEGNPLQIGARVRGVGNGLGKTFVWR